MKTLRNAALLALLIVFAAGCESNYTPKPRAYFRITLPEKEYRRFDSVYPYAFDYPVYARIKPITDTRAEPYWMDLEFPRFKGSVHLSYKKIKDRENLVEFFEDARNFANKHIPKASAIIERPVIDYEKRVFGLWYTIEGSETASYHQFYLTDSLNHFLRGALYFKVAPNNDSLQPVIDFMGQDIARLIQSMEWK